MEQNKNQLIKQFEGKEYKLQEFKNDKFNIIGFLTEDNIAMFSVEDIAKAIKGKYVEIKNGKEYVRTRNIKTDLAKFDFRIESAKDFIPENMMYLLMMNGDGKYSKEFQYWIATDVLPSIRKFGVYQDREDIDKDYLKYNYKALKETFMTTPIETIYEEYIKCREWYKQNKIRIPYANNSKRRADATHTINDSKVMVMRKVISILEERSVNLLEHNKFGSVYEIDNAIKQIKDDVNKQLNLSHRGKLGQANNKINKLKEQVEFHNPSIEGFTMIPVHGFSVNSMYKDNKRTDSYNRWIYNFPNEIIRENFNYIDLSKPTKLWLKFDSMKCFDVDGMIKSIQDQIVRALHYDNDNNIELGSVERNKIVNSYKEGKIYILLKNI